LPSKSYAVPGRSTWRFALCGRPTGTLAGLRRAAQTSLQRFEQNFSKSIAATLPHFGRPAQWTLSPPATSCCLEWTERGHFFETVGSCWTGQYKNFGALLLVRWGTYEKGSGSLTGCCDEVGRPVMQRVVEHRRTQNFARGSHGDEVLRICIDEAVSRAVTSFVPYH
jgi:hypothetical protein